MVKGRILDLILSGDYHQPHEKLGIHPEGKAKRITVFRPDASEVTIRALDDSFSVPCQPLPAHPGAWAATLDGEHPSVYAVSATDSDGLNQTDIDPYQFLPGISDDDLYLFNAGDHRFIYEKLGANRLSLRGTEGFLFAVWAPAARRVSVVGDFNAWNGLCHPMRTLGNSGVWELFIPGLKSGEKYKFEIKTQIGEILVKSDPYARFSELRPATASITWDSRYKWEDEKITGSNRTDSYSHPVNIYELHIGSWMKNPDGGWLSYRELTPKLISYAKSMHFTHIEFMPVMEHPFDGSWGYQVTGYYAPTSRFGTPDDFKYLIDQCHLNGLKIILDWVPAHFPKDEFALGRFDGTALYEHSDPRKGEHPDWGTYIFNYGRNEVKNFLIANAVYWIREFHADGLRIDAVASMLYLDYSRREGEWIPNRYGGRENLDAIEFIKHMNSVLKDYFPDALIIAEESTSFGNVSFPVRDNGLGFDYKWNMGWMNDVLRYFAKDPIYRAHHHNDLTFSMVYAWSEHFILVLSHDEVVHGKRSLISKMPGDDWQKQANYRLLLAYMMTHPGKKLNFMGYEFSPWREWSPERGMEWDLLQWDFHRHSRDYVRDLNSIYLQEKALWQRDHRPDGFEWIDVDNTRQSIISFIRRGENPEDILFILLNFTPQSYRGYRVGIPDSGRWDCIFNSDDLRFGGSGFPVDTKYETQNVPWQYRSFSLSVNVPPLGALILKQKI